MSSKTALIIAGIILVLLGIAAAASMMSVSAPMWLAIVEIIVGLVALYIGATDKKTA